MGKAFDDQEDDVEEFEAEADDNEAEADEQEGDTEVTVEAGSGSGGGNSSRERGEEVPEERTVASRQKQREQMEKEIEEFLARVGKIHQIEPNVTADPPRKPDSDYGSRPI